MGGPLGTNDADVLSLRTAMKNTIFSRISRFYRFLGLRKIIPGVQSLSEKGIVSTSWICHCFFPLFSYVVGN